MNALRLAERTDASSAGVLKARIDLLLAMDRISEARALAAILTDRGLMPDESDQFSRTRTRSALARLVVLGRDDAARRLAAETGAISAKELERGNRAGAAQVAFIRSEIVLGHRNAAIAALEQWRRENQLRQNRYQRVTQGFFLASLYALLGKADDAIALLREYAASGIQFPISLRYDFDYAPIRSDPRFQELMRQQEAWAQAQPDPVDL